MKRSRAIAGLALTAVPSGMARAATDDNLSATPSPLAWRYVILLDPFRVGVLTAVGAIVVERPDAPRSVLNLPRASPGARGWVPAHPPSVPYVVPERRTSDTITLAEPDEITVATSVRGYAILGVQTPPFDMPIALMPSFLIRIIPAELKMETYAMPPESGGAPAAIFGADEQICVVSAQGVITRIEG